MVLARKSLAAIVGLALAAPASWAATDGTIGTTSTGTVSVSLSVPSLVRITGIADLGFGKYSGSGSMSLNDDVCIWTNVSAGNYRVKARGPTSPAYDFLVSKNDDAAKTIPYTMKWNDTTGTTGSDSLTANVDSLVQSNANTTSQTCSGGSNANFEVTFASSDLATAGIGRYTGTLTIIISPQ